MENKTEELYHHGVPGMKWGVRRYQNKDGSLTSKGRKRMITNLGKSKFEALKKKFKAKDDKKAKKEEPKKEKTVKEMSDDELRARVNRLRNEKDALDLERQINSMTPKQVSAGKKFMSHVWKNVITPAATNAGRDFLEKYMKNVGNDILGNDVEDPITKLRKEVDTLELENRKSEALSKKNKTVDPVKEALRQEVELLELQKRKKKAEDVISGKSKK